MTAEERERSGVIGLLPPRVETIDEQVARVLADLRGKPSALEKHIYLASVQNDNETLFFRTLISNLEETVPQVAESAYEKGVATRARPPDVAADIRRGICAANYPEPA